MVDTIFSQYPRESIHKAEFICCCNAYIQLPDAHTKDKIHSPNPNLFRSICKHFRSPILTSPPSSPSSLPSSSSLPKPHPSSKSESKSRSLQHTNKCRSSGGNSAARVLTSAVSDDPSSVRVKLKKGIRNGGDGDDTSSSSSSSCAEALALRSLPLMVVIVVSIGERVARLALRVRLRISEEGSV